MIVKISKEGIEFVNSIVEKKILFNTKELKKIARQDLESINKMLENVELRLNKNIGKKETAIIYTFLSSIKKLYSNMRF
jgi:hypothetical protein